MRKNSAVPPSHGGWPAWYDGKNINEVLFCEEFLAAHPMKCIRGKNTLSPSDTNSPPLSFFILLSYTGITSCQGKRNKRAGILVVQSGKNTLSAGDIDVHVHSKLHS